MTVRITEDQKCYRRPDLVHSTRSLMERNANGKSMNGRFIYMQWKDCCALCLCSKNDYQLHIAPRIVAYQVQSTNCSADGLESRKGNSQIAACWFCSPFGRQKQPEFRCFSPICVFDDYHISITHGGRDERQEKDIYP